VEWTSEEEEEEEDNGLGTSGLPYTLTKTQKLGNVSGGFLYDDREEPVFNDRPRPSVSATDSDNDLEAIEQYIKSIKKRAQESNHSSTQDKSVIPHRPQLWMLPVPVNSFYIVFMIG
jgi:hypothetical protein